MATHRVTFELSDESIKCIQNHMASGDYRSESEVIESALMARELSAKAPSNEEHPPQWFLDDMLAASDELDAHPERALSPEQVEEYLTRRRSLRARAA